MYKYIVDAFFFSEPQKHIKHSGGRSHPLTWSVGKKKKNK